MTWAQKEGQERSRQKQKGLPVNLPETSNAAAARDPAGKTVGVSGKLLDMADNILEHDRPEFIAGRKRGRIAARRVLHQLFD